ncbi:14096_t:CDS:1, partial [Cetraspora pellucida]
KNIQMISKDEKNMFLLGILNALVRKETTKNNINKKYLTNEYQFDRNHICLEAFLLIYDVSEWKWKSIYKHFLENDILLITHQLKEKISNNKISFEIIINILIFISNYANIHGLPSS